MSKVIDLEGKSPGQIAKEIHDILWVEPPGADTYNEHNQYKAYGLLCSALVEQGGWSSSSLFC